MADGPPIQRLTEDVMEARGIEYKWRWLTLKNYLTELDDIRFADQVARVTDVRVLTYLLSLGLNAYRQVKASERYTELTK